MRDIRTVGITGAAGNIGITLQEGLSEAYDLHLFDKEPSSSIKGAITVFDLSNRAAFGNAFKGLDAIIHLAADIQPSSPWESIHLNNIVATYNTFEEARNSGVKRIVFASSNHTQHGASMKTTPETLDTEFVERHGRIKLTDQPNPDSFYAVSKLFGEHLGKLYSEQYGIQFIALRIGWTIPEDDPTVKVGKPEEDYMRAMFLSKKDCVTAFELALQTDKQFVLAYAISNNDRRVFDLEETGKVLGFFPEDDAEDYFV